jgi:hypothetical protein
MHARLRAAEPYPRCALSGERLRVIARLNVPATVEFTPEKPGEIAFACGTNMAAQDRRCAMSVA